ncbi:MAG: SGNH/GDSL hydrolase family protein [Ruminococcaceae bacterium]|nr:SGNH/GDSL hydrolase family protein [Oscillospiraceae bacterium]
MEEITDREGGDTVLSGKRISILGDSISTYQNISNDASVNATLLYYPYYYRAPFPPEKTYWRLVMDALGLVLCVNNSWSGGNLSGRADPTSGVNRATHLSRDDGTAPDLIIVFMGINDLGRGVDADVFAADYRHTLMTLKETYPAALVCCVNLPDRDPILKQRALRFNAIIEEAVAAAGDGFWIADLFASRLNNDFYYMNTLDGLHPDEDGMRIIAEIVKDAILQHCKK